MMTADIDLPDRQRRKYSSFDVARYQDILIVEIKILNICVRWNEQAE